MNPLLVNIIADRRFESIDGIYRILYIVIFTFLSFAIAVILIILLSTVY